MSAVLNSPGGLFDGADVIHAYSRADALRDGQLIDLGDLAREAGFKWPVAITAAAHADLIQWSHEEDGFWQDEDARAWDVLMVTRNRALRQVLDLVQSTGEVPQRVDTLVYRHRRGSKAEKPSKGPFSVHVGPGDDGQPVITLMLTTED